MGQLLAHVAHLGEGGERSFPYGPDLLIILFHFVLLPKAILDKGVEYDHEEDEEDARQQPQVYHLDIGRGGQRRGTLETWRGL